MSDNFGSMDPSSSPAPPPRDQAGLQGGPAVPRTNPGTVGPVLFTSGYEQHRTPSTLVTALTDAGVERLVDVRELPLSRRRGFSKTGLDAGLAEVGIAYEHVRALGNPKPYRDLYRAGRQDEGEPLYRAHLRNGSTPAVDALAEGLADEPVCLLCFEEDHRTCHRAVIVEELRERLPDLRVEHL